MTLVLAHRGASKAARENTQEAFRLAAGQGADGVELDVHLMADDELAVHHDARLPDGRSLWELSRDDLPEWVPTLAQAIDACADLRLLNVELKGRPIEPRFESNGSWRDRLARRTVATLALLRRSAGATQLIGLDGLTEGALVSSFDPSLLAAVRHVRPVLATGLLLEAGVADWDRALAGAQAAGYVAIHPHHSDVDAPLVTAAHRCGLAVMAWTVDDPARIAVLGAMGADGIITNVPAVARAALREVAR